LTYAVSVMRNPPSPTLAGGSARAADGGVSTQVYAVRDLLVEDAPGGLPGLTIDQIVEPLEAALNVDAGDSSAEPAKLMVHKASNLILVRGTARQNALVRQVLDRLREDTVATRALSGREREQRRIADELQKQFQVRQRMLEMQSAEQEKRMEALSAQLEKARKDNKEDQAAALTNALHETESSLSMVQKQMAQNKLDMAEAPFEASRQARMASGNGELVSQLRAEIDSLRKQIEDLRAARSGSK
jgi:chromosome segregation ATPase